MALFNLKGKVALITGGGKGIGQAISKLFARQDAEVLILERDIAAAKETVENLRNDHLKAWYFTCDVANQEEVKKTIDGIQAKHGQIDILVNNAGISHIGTVESTSEEDFDRVFGVNVKGVYNVMKAVVPHMKNQGGGAILNMASIASVVGIKDRFAYSMTKGAVLTMTLSVAKDYLEEGIRCNCISPARVHTPFVDDFIHRTYPGQEKEMFNKLAASQPIGRMGKPQEIAHLALYLCSDEASFITGTNYPIDGGFISINN